MKIAVWFSCGAPSAVAAFLTLGLYPDADVRIVNNPVIEEHEDNRRFLSDVQKWLGVEIEQARHPKYPNASAVEVWDDVSFMSGPKGAPCTKFLKKHARQHWENVNKPDHHVFGFTFEEQARHERFVKTERSNVLPVLIDDRMTRQACADLLVGEGLRLPEAYALGLPNANCLGCVKASSPTYWNHIRKIAPDVFESRARQSERIGARLVRVKGERILLSELHPDARGRPLNVLKMPQCGIHCEEAV